MGAQRKRIGPGSNASGAFRLIGYGFGVVC